MSIPCPAIIFPAALAAIGYFVITFFNALALYNIRREHNPFSNSHTYSQLPQQQKPNGKEDGKPHRARGSSAARSIVPEADNIKHDPPQSPARVPPDRPTAKEPAAVRKQTVPQLFVWIHRCFIGGCIFYGLDQIVTCLSFGRAPVIPYEQMRNWRIASLVLTCIADSCFSFPALLFSIYYTVKTAFATAGLLMPGTSDHPRLRLLRVLLIGLGVCIVVFATATPNIMCIIADKHAWVGLKNLAHGIVLFTAASTNVAYTLSVYLSARAHDQRMMLTGQYGSSVMRPSISQSDMEAGKGGTQSVQHGLNSISKASHNSIVANNSADDRTVLNKLRSFWKSQAALNGTLLVMALFEVLFYLTQVPDEDKLCVLPMDTCAFPAGFFVVIIAILVVLSIITWVTRRPHVEQNRE